MAAAQQPRCQVAVNVIKPDGGAISGLTAGDFVAHLQKQPLVLESAATQAQPRRVLLVIDNTRELSADGRRLETEYANALVHNAQPTDSFALLATGGEQVKFGADRAALLQAIAGLAAKKPESGGVLDRIAEGLSWFGQPQLGDAVVVIGEDLRDKHKRSVSDVSKLLATHGVRVFGVALGRLQLGNSVASGTGTTGNAWSHVEPGVPLGTGDYGDPDFLPFAANSGGYVISEYPAAARDFKLTNPKTQQAQKTAATMARLIDEVYSLRWNSPAPSKPEPLTVTLSKEKQAAFPGAHVLYPHEIAPCQ